jgi:hypothetical protein
MSSVLSYEVIPGYGAVFEITDVNGFVHNIQGLKMTAWSQADQEANETIIQAGMLRIHVEMPRADVMAEVRRAQAEALGY